MISTSKTILNEKYKQLWTSLFIGFVRSWFIFVELRRLDRSLGVPFLETPGAKGHLAFIKVRLHAMCNQGNMFCTPSACCGGACS